MESNEQMFLIPKSVVMAIGEYLATRPWKEVNQVMPVLQGLELASPSAAETATSPGVADSE